MSSVTGMIPDGEYDIDLSVLAGEAPESFAIRYGFVPDSMDQSQPLTLYRTNHEMVLEARSLDREGSIIFESVGKQTATADSYYLTFEGDASLSLHRLHKTYRVSKSRNTAKWGAQIKEWHKSQHIEVPSGRSQSRTPATPSDTRATAPPQRPPATTRGPAAVASSASKRPPRRESPIISESDFEDLEDAGFPEFNFGQEAAVARPSAGEHADDDFKDLEDQLQEVLEDEDSEDDYAARARGPISIEIDEGAPRSAPKYIPDAYNQQQGSLSLRELTKRKKKDDEESSEEE
ncbi:Transcription elongation factor Eaf N-terminal domain-containing protein [[Candida] zeylanoides]